MILSLQQAPELYKKYNLLTNEGKIKSINPDSIRTKKWVKTLNLSPYYRFVIKQVTNGEWKIFIQTIN